MNFDLSKVPHVEKRKELERINLELEASVKKLREARYDLGRLVTDWDGNVQRCALSGLPIFADDETLGDEETGEVVLRCLILPPRPMPEDEAEAAE